MYRLSCLIFFFGWLAHFQPLAAQCVEDFNGTLEVSGGIWTQDVGWSIVSSEGSAVAGGGVGTFPLCLPADCYTLELTDSFGDGWTGTAYVLSDAFGVSLYSGSLNDATEGDGESWGTDFIPLGGAEGCGVGCSDPGACNYDATAVLDGPCDYACIGCMHPEACNFDPSATLDSGECWEIDACGECGGFDASCSGCTDPTNCAYDPAALVDDGSCVAYGEEVILSVHTDDYPFETQWQIENIYTGTVVFDGNYDISDTTYVHEICLPPGCYELKFFDWSWDGLCCAYGEGWYTLEWNGALLAEGGEYGEQAVHPFCLGANYGCTDPSGCNFDPAALSDDGSCDFTCHGCTDPTACNFDVAASYNDSTCEYPGAGGFCVCDNVFSFSATLDGGQFTQSVDNFAEGDLESVTFEVESFAYVNDDGTSLTDMMVAITDPSGNCVAFGGFFFDVPTGCQNWGDYHTYPNYLYNPDGTTSLSVDVAEAGLTGAGNWQVYIGNGYWTSDGFSITTDVVLDGLCLDSPPPPVGCPEDLNQDGSVTVADMLILLSDFGCISGCVADINGDGATNVTDMLILLAAFGEDC